MKQEREPYIFRRHLEKCRFHGPGGRAARQDQCRCPYHADGIYHGERIRQSLQTRSRQVAERRLAEQLRAIDAKREIGGPQEITLGAATKRFLDSHEGNSAQATVRKYRTKLTLLESFCESKRVGLLTDVTGDVLEAYRRSRSVKLITWKVELQALRTFFGFCVRRKWLASNPALEVRSPKNVKPNDVVPYTLREEGLILAACDAIGGSHYQRVEATYERRRAKAMVMLLRHTALRVSDVCTLRRDAVSWDEERQTWRVLLRTQKSGEPVHLPIPLEVKFALDALPLPRRAPADCPYYFWNGFTSFRAVVGIAERALGSVFKKSGVPNAKAHRFRHTLATRLLGQGATYEQVADILGNSPDVVRKHYGKWSKGRQDSIDRLMMAHFQTGPITSPVTNQSRDNLEAVS